jgi:fatty acid desaturase
MASTVEPAAANATPSGEGAVPTADADSKQLARTVSELVRDLMRPNSAIYWTDLVLTLIVANIGVGYWIYSSSLPLSIVGLFVGALAFYRASIFIHELQHLRAGTFRAFKTFWNVFAGIPLMLPQFMYAEHRGHHRNTEYGTAADAEYLQLMRQPWFSLLYMATRVVWLPAIFILRFLLLPPLAWVFPSVRRWTWRNASTIGGINLLHVRELPDADEEWYWKLQEFGACCYIWFIVGSILLGFAPWTLLAKLYIMGVVIVCVSHTRTLTSHRFINDGSEMTYLGQLLDSTTIPGPPVLTALWCPVGMRYHALHHLVPTLPYHNMAEAHRRLMATLPADSPYRETLRTGLFDALRDIVRTAQRQSQLLRTQTTSVK